MGEHWMTPPPPVWSGNRLLRSEYIGGALIILVGAMLLSRGVALDGDVPIIAGALLILTLGVAITVSKFGANARIRASEKRYRELFEGSSVAIWEQDWSAVADFIGSLNRDQKRDLRAIIDDDYSVVGRAWSLVRSVGRNRAASAFGTVNASSAPSSETGNWFPLNEIVAKDVLLAFANSASSYEAEMKTRSASGCMQALVVLADFPRSGKERSAIVSVIDVSRQRKEAADLLRHRWRLNETSRAAAARFMTRLMVSELASQHLGLGELVPTSVECNERSSRALEGASMRGKHAGSNPLVERGRELLARAPGRLEPIVLSELLADAVALLGPELEDNAVTVHIIIEPGLPEVTADRAELTGVVAGLIENSVDAMANSSIAERNLTISANRHDADEVLVVVADSGPGADRPQWTRMFEPLVSPKPSGVGLGLTVFRDAVEATGGRIWASAGPSGGFALKFTLPANG